MTRRLAGLAFGIAGLARAENAFFLLVALAAVYVLAPGSTSIRQAALLLSCAAAVWLHAAIHLLVYRTHYYGILRVMLFSWLPALASNHLRVGVCFVGMIAALVLWRYCRAHCLRWASVTDFGLVIALLMVSLWSSHRAGWSSLRLLESCIGVPTLLGGGVGLLLLLWRRDQALQASRLLVLLAALMFAQLMIAPHAQPVPIWTARRAVTMVLPALCVGLALLCGALARRWHWMPAAIVFCAGMLGEGPLLWQLRSNPGLYRGATRHVQAIAALVPPHATLLFDGHLVASGLATTLWGAGWTARLPFPDR